MGLPEVDIQLGKGQLGAVSDLGGGKGALLVLADGVSGHAAGDVKNYGSYDELPEQLQVLDAMKRYFDLANGIHVAVMVVPGNTAIKDAVSATSSTPYLKQLAELDTDVRFVGVIGELSATDMQAACTAAQSLAEQRAGAYAPIIVVLPYAYDTADTVVDLAAASHNRVAVCVSQTGEEVGLLIGRLASTPVQRNIGRVKDGAMPVLDPTIAAGVNVSNGLTIIKNLHEKGYITMRKHIGRVGVYFTDDPMACVPTDDYHSLANRRVIDKAAVIAYDTYLEELLDEVVISDGVIHPGIVKSLQAAIESAIGNQMLASGEIQR